MSELQIIGGVLIALFALVAIGGGLYSSFRSTDQESRIKRLQSERDDLLSRVNFIEPRLEAAEDQNRMLRELHNPAKQIAELSAQETENHRKTYELLTQQHNILQQIEGSLKGHDQ